MLGREGGDIVRGVGRTRDEALAELELLRRRVRAVEAELRATSEDAEVGPSEGASLVARERLLTEAERIARVGSFVYHIASGTLHWSDELLRIFGLDPATDAPLGSAAFDAAVHPDDVAAVRAARARAAVGDPPPLGFRIRRRDGALRHVFVQGTAVRDATGAPVRVIGTLQDITERLVQDRERRRQEEMLRVAEALGNLGSWRWWPATGEVVWSDQLRVILGLSSDEPATVDGFVARIHPDDRARTDAMMAKILVTGAGEPIEYRVVRPDGEVRQVLTSSQVLVEDGVTAVIGTVLDVTELRGLEMALFQARKLEALGRLAGGLAHDFNNLLAVMQLAADEVAVGVRHPALDDLLTAIDRGATLTRQLLAFGRKTALEPRVVAVDECVRQCVTMCGRLLGDAVRIEVGALAAAGRVFVDPAQLQNALLNLLLNARDAMPRGGTIRITATPRTIAAPPSHVRPVLAPGAYVELEVRDEGEGLDERARAHLFEPFFTTKASGTGLGLATLFGAISQSGGGVGVESSAAGTAFQLFVPAAGDEPGAVTPPRSAPAAPGRGERVLVLDDRQDLRQLLARVLELAGFDPICAEEPREVIAEAGRWARSLDVVVTDVAMGGPHGPDVARALWQYAPGLPVLFISGHLGGEQPCADAVAPVGFLAKPFASAQLVEALSNLLAQARAAAA